MEKLSPETIAKIEKALEELKDPNSETFKRHQIAVKQARKRIQPLLDAIAASERITHEDLQIVINAR